MLVLTRKQNEAIQIGHDVVIKVISTGRGKVKIGIEAPQHVKVLRAELDEETKAKRLEDHAPQGDAFPTEKVAARLKKALAANSATAVTIS